MSKKLLPHFLEFWNCKVQKHGVGNFGNFGNVGNSPKTLYRCADFGNFGVFLWEPHTLMQRLVPVRGLAYIYIYIRILYISIPISVSTSSNMPGDEADASQLSRLSTLQHPCQPQCPRTPPRRRYASSPSLPQNVPMCWCESGRKQSKDLKATSRTESLYAHTEIHTYSCKNVYIL